MTDVSCCPTCRQPIVARPDFHFHAEAGIVVIEGRFASLTKREALILETLLERPGRVFTKEALLERFSVHEVDLPELRIIDVFICKIRRKLSPLGFVIKTIWGEGYSAVPPLTGEADV